MAQNENSIIYTNKEECLEAIKNNSFLDMNKISPELLKNPQIVVALISANQTRVNLFKEQLIEEPSLMDKVFSEIDSTLYHRLSEETKNDPQFMKQLAKLDENAIYHIGDELMDDFNFVKDITRINSDIVIRLSEEDKKNPEKMAELMTADPKVFKYAGENLRNSREFVLDTLDMVYSDMYEYVGDDMKTDKEFVLKAAQKRPGILRYVDDNLKNDREIWLAALEQNKDNLEIFDTLMVESRFEQMANDPIFVQNYNKYRTKPNRKPMPEQITEVEKEEADKVTIEQVQPQELSLVNYEEKRKGLRGLVDRFKKLFSKKEEVEIAEISELEEKGIIIPQNVKNSSREEFVNSFKVKEEDLLQPEETMQQDTKEKEEQER